MISVKNRLSKRNIKEINSLQEACNEFDKGYYALIYGDETAEELSSAVFIMCRKRGKLVSCLMLEATDEEGVNDVRVMTHPKYRKQGYAGELFERAICTYDGEMRVSVKNGSVGDKLLSKNRAFEYDHSELLLKRKQKQREDFDPEDTESVRELAAANGFVYSESDDSESENINIYISVEKSKTSGEPLFKAVVIHNTDSSYLCKVEVAECERGKGIGTKYLGKLIESIGRDIVLQVSSGNIAAMKLYEKHGFKVKEEEKIYRYTDQNAVDEKYMRLALEQAKLAGEAQDVPIGCVIVMNDEVIAEGYNKRNANHSVLGHAETEAIEKASKKLNDWRLEGATMYVTLEPCQMCAGALVQSRIDRVVIGAMSPKSGSMGSVINILEATGFNHSVSVTKGVLEEECNALLTSFFKELRAKKVSKSDYKE